VRSITVSNLISGNVAVRYNEGSEVVVTGDVVLAAPSRLRGTINLLISSTTTKTETTTITPSMDTSGDSNMDTDNSGSTAASAIASVVANAASLTLVKAERPDHLTSTSPTTVTTVASGPIGNSLFTGITNSNKTARSDDWLATNSPESPQNSLPSQHVVYSTAQQQLSEQQQPPMAHSSPLAHQQQVSNNGYASPMSTGSYDPYSPNGKIGK